MEPQDNVPVITSSREGSRSLHYARTGSYCLAFLAFGLEVNLMGPTIPTLAKRTHVTEADLGPLFTLTGLTCLVGAFPSGYLVDRMPGHVILGTAMLLQAIGLAIIPFCYTLTTIYINYCLIAFTWNFVNTTGNTLVMWRTQKEGGALVNVIHALFGVGSFCSPLVVELFRSKYDSALAAFWCIAAFCAIVGVIFFFVPSPENPHKHRQGLAGPSSSAASSQDGAEASGTAASGTAEAGADALPGSSSAAEEGSKAADGSGYLSGRLLWGAIVPTFVMIWVCVGTEVGYGGWIVTYALRYLGLEQDVSELLNALYWGSFTVGRVVASFAAAVLPPGGVLLLSLPLGLAGAVLPLVAPIEALRTWGIYVATIMVGVGISPGFANSLALLSSRTHITGALQGVISAFSGAGCMMLPLVVSLLAKHTALGFQGLMWLCVVSFSAMLGMLGVVACCGKPRAVVALEARAGGEGVTEPLLGDSV